VPGIADGASADIVVYDEDPRYQIETLRNPQTVILRGEPLKAKVS
jgi:imidazolonepropionase-like amidohydrolase